MKKSMKAKLLLTGTFLLSLQISQANTSEKIFFTLQTNTCSAYVNDLYTDKLQFQTNMNPEQFMFNKQYEHGIFDHGNALRLSLFELGEENNTKIATIKNMKVKEHVAFGMLMKASQKNNAGKVFTIKKLPNYTLRLYSNQKDVEMFNIAGLTCHVNQGKFAKDILTFHCHC